MNKSYISNLLLLLACVAIVVLFIQMFDLYPLHNKLLRSFVFIASLAFSIYTLTKKDYYLSLVFASIALIYNPFFPAKIDHDEWLLVHIPVLIFIGFEAYTITQEATMDKIEMTAYSLDLYLKELENIICQLSYYQTLLYLKKRYPDQFELKKEKYTWMDEGLPDFQFEINSEFYLPGKTKKGGVSAIGKNKYYSVEIHLNFALTQPVKYIILQRRLRNYQISNAARQLKSILKQKYHYVEV